MNTEFTQPSPGELKKTEFTQPSPGELKKMVHSLISSRPERHEQSLWVTSAFPGGFASALVENVRSWLDTPGIPSSPLAEDGACGTKACIARVGRHPGFPSGDHDHAGRVRLGRVPAVPGLEGRARRERGAAADGPGQRAVGLAVRSARTRNEVLAGLELLISDPDASPEDLEMLEELYKD